MKLWGFLLAETLLIGGATALVVVGSDRIWGGTAAAWEAQAQRPPAVQAPERDPFDPPVVAITRTPAGTFTGILDELLLQPLRTQDVRDVKFNRGGSSISLRVTFADGSRAAFKPLQNNVQTVPRKEIAAYWINRLLGLNNVPPACARTLHKDDLFGKLTADSRGMLPRLQQETIFDEEGFTRGEVSYWIPVVVSARLDDAATIEQWTSWLTIGNEIPPGKVGLMSQLSSLLVFDLLTNNSDRFSGGNLLGSPDGKLLYYMDNTFGFQIEPGGHEKCRSALLRCQKFSRGMVEALRRFDGHGLRAALESDPGVLTDDEIASVVARRDVALRYIDGLVSRHGADRVLVFP